MIASLAQTQNFGFQDSGFAIRRFQAISRKYLFFHFLFIGLVVVELLFLALFLHPLIAFHCIGIAVGSIFFTCLMYALLRLYFQEQKNEEFIQLKNAILERSSAIVDTAFGIADALKDIEKTFYNKTPLAQSPLTQRLSAYLHWPDVYAVRELFLLEALAARLSCIRKSPTHAEAHAALAHTYKRLAAFYADSVSLVQERYVLHSFLPSTRMLQTYEQKRKNAIQGALEELKIVTEYAPQELWARESLAACYRDLGLYQEQLCEYETLLQLKPDSPHILLELGKLHFQQGCNGKGLKVYERLQGRDTVLAAELIGYYGIHSTTPS